MIISYPEYHSKNPLSEPHLSPGCPLGIGVNETAPGPRSCNHSPHPWKCSRFQSENHFPKSLGRFMFHSRGCLTAYPDNSRILSIFQDAFLIFVAFHWKKHELPRQIWLHATSIGNKSNIWTWKTLQWQMLNNIWKENDDLQLDCDPMPWESMVRMCESKYHCGCNVFKRPPSHWMH